jgi:hypothetical protein
MNLAVLWHSCILHPALLLMVSTRKLVLPAYWFHVNLIFENEIMPFKTFVYCDSIFCQVSKLEPS